ncbi:site-specific integrase [Clostridium botulinum]|uniref:Phage integrase site specific recombinase n=1 Tax=Clostridium botulinum CFSAN001627 TaxID=1232189 RepID=M1ZYL3_CLOBO|nr:site-specific integrase [Clostridium botulinum]EKN42480.1 phage integrase site specific recombinase [Clostridium botulinum CFSAN001627]MBY6756122.1 site-specific integrase [Clostridium botulinum]MBY6907824.1 site-specific integrase [Clostridium botulinum]MBY6922795.1 site-specific integrase [Clostridium botulinum]NFM70717.1 site-specific integrase [Clostridium botulinum]
MKGSVRKKGNRWYYSFYTGTVDGKRKRIERAGGDTKKEAETALRNALNEFENCGSVLNESNISVSDYFDYWHKEYALINCKYNTQVNYKRIIEKHIKPNLGVYKLKILTPAILQEFLNKKYRNGFAKNTLSNFYGVLSGALKMAVYPYKLIKENPMTYVAMPKYNNINNDKDDLKILSLENFKEIINRFPEGSNFYIPLQIAFNTGMRAAEVCGLTWDCIDLKNSTITIKKIIIYKNKEWIFGTPKTKSSYRTILIGNTLVNILKHHKKHQIKNKLKYGKHYTLSNFVCTKENGELVTTNSLKYLSRVVNYELQIPFNFHSLRHTHATMLLESGANIKDIQKRLGHSKLATTMDTYSHVTKNLSEDSVAKFESIISSIK